MAGAAHGMEGVMGKEVGDNRFTMPALDTDGFGKPPDVEFVQWADGKELRAAPEMAFIRITAEEPLGATFRSRIQLTDLASGVELVDMVLHHLDEPRWEEWQNAAWYASEVACALYWSMWRRNKLRERDGDQ